MVYLFDYIIPSDNWEQQPEKIVKSTRGDYIIPSDNWEQQLLLPHMVWYNNYIIPSDNWEQQLDGDTIQGILIISYQAITGNNNSNGCFYEPLRLYHTKR